ncbi:hypothetical protein [Streptomyces sp. NPDC056600]|uniref:hypothetical protein n=1 Tax=Streptomyces sp. NPDC056600 TaxID=3345874 RepID=UPI0036AB9253
MGHGVVAATGAERVTRSPHGDALRPSNLLVATATGVMCLDEGRVTWRPSAADGKIAPPGRTRLSA